MSHFPFIFLSYLLAAILLAGCAAAPLLRKRRLIRNLKLSAVQRQADHGDDDASNT